jgi:type I restriction enzyme, S subunit
VSKLNPRKGRVLVTVPRVHPMVASSEFIVLEPFGIEVNFARYLLSSEGVRQFLSSAVQSVTRSHQRVDSSTLTKGWVALPRQAEQRAIADFLDTATARLDNLRLRKQSLISRLREKRDAVIAHAVTRGVESRQNDGAEIGRHRLTNDSRVPWVPEIPAHWRIFAVKHLARKGRKSFTDGDWVELPFIADAGIRLIQTGNVGIGSYKEQGFRYISEESFHELGCTEIFPNDVLICRLDGPVGRACLVPNLGIRMITSVDNTILRVGESVDARFVVYLM